MFKWIIRKILGETKKEIEKTILNSGTTRTVAVSSISTIMVCRAVCAFLAELDLIPKEMVDETALVISAVLIPFVSRLLAIVRAQLSKT